MDLSNIEQFYNNLVAKSDYWKRRNSYYHKQIKNLYKFLVPENKKILEIGSGNGDLINYLSPLKATGIDLAKNMVNTASKKHPKIKFLKMDSNSLKLNETYEYIILSDLIGNLTDLQKTFMQLHKVTNSNSRIVINYYNYLWYPLIILAEKLNLKMPQPLHNWLTHEDIKNFLELSDLEIIKEGKYILIPFDIPLISEFFNKYVARLPLINKLCLTTFLVARRKPNSKDTDYSVSLIIPARNESGNIERAIKEIPKLGNNVQIVFVEGHSKDNTNEEITRVIEKYKGKKDILLVNQGKVSGKGNAVRKGIEYAKGDMIFIFDADLTVDPSDLPKFYEALRTGKAEYIQGSRLVYPMEKQAMQFLNILGNFFFSVAFTYLLDQKIKDTLCGTKGLFKKDYEKIAQNRKYFGDFDPFGDFDLIFGASKQNLKIMEIPVRYKARTYGQTNISRFKHGWLLIKMTLFAAKKIKFF